MAHALSCALLVAMVVCMRTETVEGFDFKAIYPGTKWCGAGNKASNYDDLGRLKQIDTCCRAHDNCPDDQKIKPGRVKHGIINLSPFTMLHCDCDATFRSCLRKTKQADATVIGTTYFTVLKSKCFKKTCVLKKYVFWGPCVKRGYTLHSPAPYVP